jgi:hypothetical protein
MLLGHLSIGHDLLKAVVTFWINFPENRVEAELVDYYKNQRYVYAGFRNLVAVARTKFSRMDGLWAYCL